MLQGMLHYKMMRCILEDVELLCDKIEMMRDLPMYCMLMERRVERS